jgi:hypothetical protein
MPAFSVLQCWTASQNVEAKPDCQIKTATQTKAIRSGLSLSRCKSAWKLLGDWNPQRTMRVIPLSYTLHQFTFMTMYWRQAHVQTARKREGAWKENATWRSGKFNSFVAAFYTHVHHWVMWGFVSFQLLITGANSIINTLQNFVFTSTCHY